MPGLAERLKREIDLRAHLIARGVAFDGKLARCPLHDDSTGSVSVNQVDGIWLFKCHGCGASGSIVDLEMKTRGVDAREAIASLAAEYGIRGECGVTAPAAHTRPAVKEGAPAPVETFVDAVNQVYRSSRATYVAGDVPEADAFLASKGIPREVALRCGIGASVMTRAKYHYLLEWCRRLYGCDVKAVGLAGLYQYARLEMPILVYPHWPQCDPPDPTCPPSQLPPVKYLKFRPCVTRQRAEELGVPPHYRPAGHECADPWLPVGLPEAGGVLWIVEGETDALVIVLLGGVPAAMNGAGARLPKRFLRQLSERAICVHLLADRDCAGQTMLAERARELAEAGVEWKCFRLPDEVEGREESGAQWGKDLDDLLLAMPIAARSNWQSLLLEHQVAPAAQPALENASGTTAVPRLPVIRVDGRQLPPIAIDTWRALARMNQDPPTVFVHGGLMSRINTDGPAPFIQQFDRAGTLALIARIATWVEGEGQKASDVFPPARVAEDMLSFPEVAGLPELDQIVAAPMFDREGRLLAAPGYHASGRLWHEPAPGMDQIRVPERPTDAELAAAVDLVSELIVDFPFATAADRANCIAAFLLPFVRGMIGGCTPLHLFEAPTFGSGKSKLPEIIAILVTGRPAEPTVLPRDGEECRKKLTAALVRGQPIVLLDNASRLHSEALAAILTCVVWFDRVLGATRMLSLPNRATWLATGNNVSMSLEIARRTVRSRIDTGTDRPWLRTGFRHDPLLVWVEENRARIVTALLTIVSRWIAMGRPLGSQTLGSFEQWARVMGGILQTAGIDHFLGNLDDFYGRIDTHGREWRAFCGEAFAAFGGLSARVSQYVDLCRQRDLLVDVRGDKGERSECIRLGKALAKMADRVFGEYLIVPGSDRHGKSQTYAIVRTARDEGRSDPAGSGGMFAGCHSDTSRRLTPCSVSASPRLRDVAGSLRGGEFYKNSEYYYGNTAGTERGGQNIPQHPAEDLNPLSRNELTCGILVENIPQTTRNYPHPPSPAVPFAAHARETGGERDDTTPCLRTPPLSPQPCRGRGRFTAEGSDADITSTTPALPFHLPPDWRDWPEDIRVEFEERAAIREYDGGQSRAEAESAAEAEVRAKYERADEQRESEVA